METEKKFASPGQEKEDEKIQPIETAENGVEKKEAMEDFSKKEEQMITDFLEKEAVNAGEITGEAKKPEEKKSGIRKFLEKHPKIIALIMAITVSTSLMAGSVEAKESGWNKFWRESGKSYNSATWKNNREYNKTNQEISKITHRIQELNFEKGQLKQKLDDVSYRKIKIDMAETDQRTKDREMRTIEREENQIQGKMERIDRDIYKLENQIEQKQIERERRAQDNNFKFMEHSGKVFIENVLFPKK